jgi:hypothetical protein
MGTHDNVLFPGKSKHCAGAIPEGSQSEVSQMRIPHAPVVMFRIARVRFIGLGSRGGAKRGFRGDRVVGGVAGDGLRKRPAAEARRTGAITAGESAAECSVPAGSGPVAGPSPTASMRTAASATACGTGAATPAGSRRACRNGPARCSNRKDYDEDRQTRLHKAPRNEGSTSSA